MSTLSYAALTNRREMAPSKTAAAQQPGDPKQPGPTGLQTYIDAFAALVPSEVLTLHALIISVTTTTTTTSPPVTTITSVPTLAWAFRGLLLLSIILFAAPRLSKGNWDRFDYLRMLIPPFAFTGWTMLQRTTAFDAVFPKMDQASRTVIALFLGVVLGLLASALATKAEEK